MIKSNQHSGFTIIEVVLVLAIAGMLFLVVFLAVPAMQRNQRATLENRMSTKSSAASSVTSSTTQAGRSLVQCRPDSLLILRQRVEPSSVLPPQAAPKTSSGRTSRSLLDVTVVTQELQTTLPAQLLYMYCQRMVVPTAKRLLGSFVMIYCLRIKEGYE